MEGKEAWVLTALAAPDQRVAPFSADHCTLYHMVFPVLELRTSGMARGWQVASPCGMRSMEEDTGWIERELKEFPNRKRWMGHH